MNLMAERAWRIARVAGLVAVAAGMVAGVILAARGDWSNLVVMVVGGPPIVLAIMRLVERLGSARLASDNVGGDDNRSGAAAS